MMGTTLDTEMNPGNRVARRGVQLSPRKSKSKLARKQAEQVYNRVAKLGGNESRGKVDAGIDRDRAS